MRKIALWVAATLVVAAPSAKANELERETAQVLYELAPKNSKDGEIYPVASALASLGAYDAAKQVASRQLREKKYVLNAVEDAAVRRAQAMGNYANAKKHIARHFMKNEQFKMLLRLARIQIRRKHFAPARETLREAQTLSKKHGVMFEAPLAALFALAGERETAKRIFKDEIEKLNRYAAQEAEHGGAISRYADQILLWLGESGLTEETLNFAAKIPNSHPQRAFVFWRLGRRASQRNDGPLLEKLAEREENRILKTTYLYLASFAASFAGNPTKARELALKSADISESYFKEFNDEKTNGYLSDEELWFFNPFRAYGALIFTGEKEVADRHFEKIPAELVKAFGYGRPNKAEFASLGFPLEFVQWWMDENNALSPSQMEILQKVTQKYVALWQSPKNQHFYFDRSAAKSLTQTWLKLGRKKEALQCAYWWEKMTLGYGSEIAERLELSRTFGQLGFTQRMNLWKKRAHQKALQSKDISLDYYGLALVIAGFPDQGRSFVSLKSWQMKKIGDYAWGRAEGLELARRNAKVSYVTWSVFMPNDLRRREIVAYANAMTNWHTDIASRNSTAPEI